MTTRVWNREATARAAGWLALGILVVAPVPLLLSRALLVVPGDAVTTAANVAGLPALFWSVFAVGFLVLVAWLALVALLYVLFRPVSRTVSFVAALAGAAGALVTTVSPESAGLLPLVGSGGDTGAASGPGRPHALATLSLEAGDVTALAGGVLVGLHLLLLGSLALRSRLVPRAVGALLVLSSGASLVQGFAHAPWLPVNGLVVAVAVLLVLPGPLALALRLAWSGVATSRTERGLLGPSERGLPAQVVSHEGVPGEAVT